MYINKFKYKFYILVLFITNSIVFSQVTCPNVNFSDGNFNNWSGSVGVFGFPSANPGISFSNHQIISTNYLDAATCNNLNVIPDGELFSAKLGNEQGAESESLSYNLTVGPDNSLFIYKYAVVLEDPGHTPASQPGFSVKIFDNTTGTPVQISNSCGIYEVFAGQAGQDFQTCGVVKWLPWKTIALNLTPYIGKNLSIEFITRDCAFVQHFGYAYISAKCGNLRLNTKSCVGSNTVTLSAPVGFSIYEWQANGVVISNEQNYSFQVGDYPVGTVFECTITTFSNGVGCPVTIQTVLGNQINLNANFNFSSACGPNTFIANNIINFQDSSTIFNDVIASWDWTFGDGTTSNLQNPSKIYANAGSYNVKLTVTSLNGCSKDFNTNIIIGQNTIPTPIANVLQEVCNSNSSTIGTLTATGSNILWYSSAIATNPLVTSTILNTTDTYYVSQSINGCQSPRIAVKIKFYNSPSPTGNASQYFCTENTPNVQSIISNAVLPKFYSDQTSSTPIVNTTALINGASYYISQDNGCGESFERLKVTVILDDPALIGYREKLFCAVDKPTIQDLVINNSNLIWYSNITSAVPISSNTLLQNNTSYFGVFVGSPDCFKRLEVKVLIDDFATNARNFSQVFCDDLYPKLSNINVKDQKKWYADANTFIELNENENLVNGSSYYYSPINTVTGCESTQRIRVDITTVPCDVEIFNTITINNNNLNDYLHIKNIEFFPENSLVIYDKYGKTVYKTNRYGVNNNLFYGTSEGNDVVLKNKKLPTGTYYYVLIAKNDAVSIDLTKKGFLYIINNE